MKLRAYYTDRPYHGVIRIKNFLRGKPHLYEMKLMHELNGMIILKKSEFRTIEEATSNSSQHGFLSHKWQIVTDE